MANLTTDSNLAALADVADGVPTEGQRLVRRGGLWTPETIAAWVSGASMTIDYGGWKGEQAFDPVYRMPETAGQTTRPAEPAYTYTVQAADAPVVTGLPDGFAVPHNIVILMSGQRGADPNTTAGIFYGLSITKNDVDVIAPTNVQSISDGQFFTVVATVENVVAGDVIKVYAYTWGATDVWLDVDYVAFASHTWPLPKAVGDVPYLVRNLTHTKTQIPAPTTVPLLGGTWNPSTNATWYFKSRGVTTNGNSIGPGTYEVTGPEAIARPYYHAIVYGHGSYGTGTTSTTARQPRLGQRLTAVGFDYLRVPDDT